MSEGQEVIPAGNPNNMSFQGCLDKVRDQDAEIERLKAQMAAFEEWRLEEVKEFKQLTAELADALEDRLHLPPKGRTLTAIKELLQRAQEATKHDN